jgi:hypothetical protein
MSETPDICCGNPVCKVAENDQCIEGLVPASCPHYGKTPTPAEDAAAESEVPPPPPTVRFSDAEKLSLDRATQLLRQRPSRVVAILGPEKSGKTTLIAGLYGKFLNAPFASFEFARSTTLHAFESACHLSRLASGRATPDTERTKHGAFGFFHLDLAHTETQECHTLLLGDRAGEEYMAATNTVAAAQAFAEVQRATTITLLVDGAQLARIEHRHNIIGDVELLLQALMEAGVIGLSQQLAIVLTKLDLVDAAPDAARARAAFDGLVKSLTNRYTDTFASIKVFLTAASPASTTTPQGLGIDELLHYWMKPPLHLPNPPSRPPVTPWRAIGRFALLEK